MKAYLIEREIADIGKSSKTDLTDISKKSCGVLDKMDSSRIQWVHSYMEENKIHCIYKAADHEFLREHSKHGGFAISSITEVADLISPVTADH